MSGNNVVEGAIGVHLNPVIYGWKVLWQVYKEPSRPLYLP